MLRRSLTVGALFAVLALFALAGAATSQASDPGGHFEAGDAGDSLKTAQLARGFDAAHAANTAIFGNLTDVDDEDLYQICLTGGGTFSATTNPAGPGALGDPQLSLFDANGFGVYGNDDKVVNNQSTLPAGHALTPAAPGVYYLAISAFDNDAVSVGGEIFDDGASDPGPSGPTGPGGGSPLSGWTGGGESSGFYIIVLTGAIFCRPPVIEKDPELHNLWLCNEPVLACRNFNSGVEAAILDVNLTNAVKGRDPKCTGFPNFLPPEQCEWQSIGSFEYEVRFDPKLVTVGFFLGDLWPGRLADCAVINGEGFGQIRCNTKGKDRPPMTGPGTLLQLIIEPTPDVYSILVPNQLNGIVTQLINQDCQLSDEQGHPIDLELLNNFNLTGPHDVCGDAAVTIRYLEGDVHNDCVIDVRDQQQIAFRWGSRLGQLLYNERYDLEPSYPKKSDGDIDAKDLQLVYGRATSTCKDPHPAQDPVDPKAKVEPPLPGG